MRRRAGWHALGGIGLTCLLEYAMPGLLPFLAPPCDATTLFWLTALWAVSSIVGRALAASRTLRRLAPVNALQGLILVAAVGCAAKSAPPPLALAAPMIALFSTLHGLVVTSAYVLAAEHGVDGTAYAGLANQLGAMAGSLLSLALVSSGIIPKRPSC